VNEKFDKLTRLARALKEDRANFVLVGTGTTLTFLLAYVVSITLNNSMLNIAKVLSPRFRFGHRLAARTQRTIHMPRNLVTTLLMVCPVGVLRRRQAPSFSGWHLVSVPVKWLLVAKMFNTVFWGGSLTLTFLEWRKNMATRPRDPPFEQPHGGEGDEESAYEVPSIKQDENVTRSPFSDPYRYSGASSTAIGSFGSPTSPKYNIPSAPQPRPSLDAYGAFSDPAPTGFDGSPVDSGVSGLSRTMQYADPYAAVRASVVSGTTQSSPGYQ